MEQKSSGVAGPWSPDLSSDGRAYGAYRAVIPKHICGYMCAILREWAHMERRASYLRPARTGILETHGENAGPLVATINSELGIVQEPGRE